MSYRYDFSGFSLFVWMKRMMETSVNLLWQCYQGSSNQWNRNGGMRTMRRILSDIFQDKCQMIEMYKVNGIVYFFSSQSKIVYLLFIA